MCKKAYDFTSFTQKDKKQTESASFVTNQAWGKEI